MTQSTATDPVQALEEEGFTPYSLTRRPISAINIVRSAAGLPPLALTGEARGVFTEHGSFSDLASFAAWVIEQDFDAFVAPAPSLLDQPEHANLPTTAPFREPEPWGVWPDHLDEFSGVSDLSDFLRGPSPVPTATQLTLPGFEFGQVDGDGDPSRAFPPGITVSPPTADPALNKFRAADDQIDPTSWVDDIASQVESLDVQPSGPTSVLRVLSDDWQAVTALLDAADIVTLRKVSRGLVRGGYSMKKPVLVNAIVNAAESPQDIVRRLEVFGD